MSLTKGCSNTTSHPKPSRRIAMNSKLILPVLLCFYLAGCTPQVQVAPPDKPITINLNVKIEHEIRVKVDKELDDVFSEDSGLF